MRTIITVISLSFPLTATFADTINVPDDYPTISAAIVASVDGDVINISSGTYNEHTLDPAGKAITIQGTLDSDGSLATIIDAEQGGTVFFIHSDETSKTVIKDLVITGGTGSSYDKAGTLRLGGGICSFSSPTISNCTIVDCSATVGGGIFCVPGELTISNCTIQACTAEDNGGGIFLFAGTPIISNCTIKACSVEMGDQQPGQYPIGGGGIFCGEGAELTVSNCTIQDCTAPVGGGIYAIDSNFTISGSAICGNQPEQLNGSWTSGGGNNISTTCPTSCVCDVDGDGEVGQMDLAILLGAWGLCP